MSITRDATPSQVAAWLQQLDADVHDWCGLEQLDGAALLSMDLLDFAIQLRNKDRARKVYAALRESHW